MPKLEVNFYVQSTCENFGGDYDLGSLVPQLAGTLVNLSKQEELQTVKIADKTQWNFFWLKYGLDMDGNIIDPPTTKTFRKNIINSGATKCRSCSSTKSTSKDCTITITWKINNYTL